MSKTIQRIITASNLVAGFSLGVSSSYVIAAADPAPKALLCAVVALTGALIGGISGRLDYSRGGLANATLLVAAVMMFAVLAWSNVVIKSDPLEASMWAVASAVIYLSVSIPIALVVRIAWQGKKKQSAEKYRGR